MSDLLARHLPPAFLDGGRLWIGGRWEKAASGDSFASVNPSNGVRLMDVAASGDRDVDAAVSAASQAAVAWWNMDSIERGRILRRAADLIRDRWESFGVLDTLDAGRPIRDTGRKSTAGVARLFEFYAGLTDKLQGSTFPVSSGAVGRIDYQPYGVVGAISPWNYPLSNAATKIAPALACGNAVILKPAEQAPLSAMLLADCLHEAGLPAGALNVLPGLGSVAGAALVRHPKVRKISFTGSTATGRAIAAQCGDMLKSTTLELGGKSATIVFADADLAVAASAAAFTAFNNAGQTCTAGTRLLVHAGVAEEVLDRIRAEVATLTLGDPFDDATHLGPLVSGLQLARVSDRIEALKDGDGTAEALQLKRYEPVAGGYFQRPLLVRGLGAGHPLAREEIFGPVLSVFVFEDEAEALALANDSAYGLSASLWTRDYARIERMRAGLDTGLVWINCVHALHPGVPVAGRKASGLGLEYGVESMQQYMQVKSSVTMWSQWTSGFAG